jgi:zinc transporter ZupT
MLVGLVVFAGRLLVVYATLSMAKRFIKATVYFVVGKTGPIEASLDKSNLPELSRGEQIVKLRVEFEA